MIVTGVHKDCMDRQVMEGVNISNFGGDILMNRIGESGGVRVERQQYKFQEVPPIHTLPTCKRLLWCLGDASPGAWCCVPAALESLTNHLNLVSLLTEHFYPLLLTWCLSNYPFIASLSPPPWWLIVCTFSSIFDRTYSVVYYIYFHVTCVNKDLKQKNQQGGGRREGWKPGRRSQGGVGGVMDRERNFWEKLEPVLGGVH